jgi:hypothetical protein
MKWLNYVFTVAYFLFLTQGVSAQNISEQTYRQFKEDFTVGLRRGANYREKISKMRLSSDKEGILINHYVALTSDDALASRIFDEVRASGLVDRIIKDPSLAQTERQTISSLGYELFESLGNKGMKRLDSSDIRIYLNFIHMMFNVLPPTICKAALTGQITGEKGETALMVYLFRKMPSAEVDLFLRLIRKATFAEVRNFPSVKKVNESQRKLAEDAFGKLFIDELANHPIGDKLLIAAADLNRADESVACEVGRLTIGTILKMRGEVSEWQARLFLDNL